MTAGVVLHLTEPAAVKHRAVLRNALNLIPEVAPGTPIEVVVHGDADSSKVVGRRIEDITLPRGTTLGAVVRGEDVIIAHHDTTVQPDDHLILFLTDRRHIDAVERLFQGSASFL